MKNKKSFSFSIVLLLVNTIGAAGALLSSLRVDLGTVLLPSRFFAGMLLICLFTAFFWNGEGRRKMALRGCLLVLVCLIFLLLFWRYLTEGMGLALQGMLGKMNERYGIRFVWNLSQGAEQNAKKLAAQATWSVLAVMLPYVLLIGYGVSRKKAPALLAADAVWFCLSCAMDDFPDYVWLVLCILGMAAVIIQNAFRDDERAGMQAILIGTAVLGFAMALVYRFALPFLDSRYEATQEARVELSIRINEEWIPEIQRLFARFGSGPGPGTTVTGKLTRKTGVVYTADEIYRVTVTSLPKSAVYLRGFVGKDYEGDEWTADQDAAMEEYYRWKGWKLPEREELVNLAYHAFYGGTREQVSVEELAAPGKFTVYPYGAEITEEYTIHWDGTVERKSGSYVLSYSAPENYRPKRQQAGEASAEEARYREYVYDTFCEYPAERFPRLTAFLKGSGFRTDSVYHSLADVLAFLKGNAVYDLGVSNTPEGEDFVEYFLFERKRGYCAHFASSAVLMLRYLGIPARYVTGYAAAPGNFDSSADGSCSAVILDRQAHAWAEIYLDGVGWVPVEMTPGAVPFPQDITGAQLALAEQMMQADIPEEESEEAGSAAWQPVSSQGHPQGSSKPEQDDRKESEAEKADAEEPGQEMPEEPDAKEPGGEDIKQDGDSRKEPEDAGGADNREPENAGETNVREPEEAGGADNREPEESGGADAREPGQAGGADNRGPENAGGADNRGPGNVGGADNRGPGQAGEADVQAPGRIGGAAKRLQLSPGAKAALLYMSAGTALLLFSVLLWNLVRRCACRKLERSGGRERVFYLYRHTRRLLQTVGSGKRLEDPGEGTEEFIGLLEQCGFGEKAPKAEELEQAEEYCKGVAQEVWKRLPFYKKPLFLLLDLYGLHSRRQRKQRRAR